MKKEKQVDVHLAAPGGQVPSAASKGTPCPEALPCPFCGHIGVFVCTPAESFRYRAAMCNRCGALAEDVRIQTTGDGTPDEWERVAHARAIAAWNRRAAPAPKGWIFKKHEDGVIVAMKDGVGGFAARPDAESIAEVILWELANDTLAAQPGSAA